MESTAFMLVQHKALDKCRNQTKTVILRLDSNDRFETDFKERPFYKLPHGADGWNYLVCQMRNDHVYWNGKLLFNLQEIPNRLASESTDIVRFVSHEQDPDDDNNVWHREPIDFGNGIFITNAWLMLDLDPKPKDIEREEYIDVVGETCAITVTSTVTF